MTSNPNNELLPWNMFFFLSVCVLFFPCCLESHERWTQKALLPALGEIQGPTEHMKGPQRKRLNQLQKLRLINSWTKPAVRGDRKTRPSDGRRQPFMKVTRQGCRLELENCKEVTEHGSEEEIYRVVVSHVLKNTRDRRWKNTHTWVNFPQPPLGQ